MIKLQMIKVTKIRKYIKNFNKLHELKKLQLNLQIWAFLKLSCSFIDLILIFKLYRTFAQFIIILEFMLAVAPQQFELPRDQISMDSAPTIHLGESEITIKQEAKKSIFSPYKVLLGLAVIFMLVMVSFKVYNEFIITPKESQINSVHGKIIQNADSSSKDKASNSGSSSSKTSKSNDKPNTVSLPASKGTITSNSNLSGSDSSSNGGSDDEDEDKDGQKKKKVLGGNASSDTKSSKYGVSTDEDSESVESQEEQVDTNGLMWPLNKQEGVAPLIGSQRV